MPWNDEEPPAGTKRRWSSHTVWRALIIGLAVLDGLTLVGVVFLFTVNRTAERDTHALACRVGSFFVGTPIIKQPSETEQQFHHTVVKAESYLRALKAQDCTGVTGAHITTQQINRSIHRLHQASPNPPPSNLGGDAGSPPGGGQPGGGGNGQPPPSTTTTPGPTTTTGIGVCIHALNRQHCIEVNGG